MSGESARSLRKAVISVGTLGALSLSVPASLWLSPGSLFPVLQPVSQTVQASMFDDAGRLLDRPVRLRPGSRIQIVVTGLTPDEPILLRGPTSAGTVSGGRADPQGIFRYRLAVPASMSGAHSLTVIGSLDQASRQPDGSTRTAVLRFVVSADQAGTR
jgi:hypothetical protein